MGEHNSPVRRPRALQLDVGKASKNAVSDIFKLAKMGPVVAGEMGRLTLEASKIAMGSSDIEPEKTDRRFRDTAWKENPAYRAVSQGYLAWTQSVDRLGKALDDAEVSQAEAIKFTSGIVTSALSPTNYVATNPAALKKALDTGGMSLVRGVQNWLTDMRDNRGLPSMVKKGAFTVGDNLAVTPGGVVARSEMAELIQYTPTTAKVREIATLVIPPPIGRYYFLDLSPKRSFVEHAVSQGIQTFMLSWRNPTREHAEWGFADYAARVMEAVEEVKEVTGHDKVNLIGFCAGGVLASIALNKLAAEGDDSVHTMTYSVTLLDWEGKYPMNAFSNPATLALAAANSKRAGVFDSSQMGSAFTWLRPDDLVWNYWVNNYLLGDEPPPFDVLAWNADGTRLPARLHAEFLDMFGNNPLPTAGKRSYLGTPMNLATIDLPIFVQGAVTDHLTPWPGTYRTTQLLNSNDITYVLSNAGHIASLVNPPDNPKASYFTGPDAGEVDAQTWRSSAEKQQGSWWTPWAQWTAERAGEEVPAPSKLGSEGHRVLEAAPGRYIRDRIVN